MPGESDAAAVEVRRACAADAETMADVWLRSRRAALPRVRQVHSDGEVRTWIREVVVPHEESWVAVGGAGRLVVGMLVLEGDWVDQLYLDPDWRGRGIGDRLLGLAKQRRPGGLQLWTFQCNAPARRFYERHRFAAVERTDGARNEEREPDVRYAWRPETARRRSPAAGEPDRSSSKSRA